MTYTFSLLHAVDHIYTNKNHMGTMNVTLKDASGGEGRGMVEGLGGGFWFQGGFQRISKCVKDGLEDEAMA